MNRSLVILCAFLLGSSLLAPSEAGARPIAFGATLSIELSVPGGTLRYGATGAGVADVSGSSGVRTGLVLPSGFVTGTTSRPLTGMFSPIAGQALDVSNAPGSFGLGQQDRLVGRMPLAGVAKMCLFFRCDQNAAAISIPLSAVGATAYRTFTGAGIHFSISGSPWSAGSPGGTSNPLSMSLVAPIFLSTSLATQPIIRGLARLDLVFAETIPEPATLVLVGAGTAALAAGGRRRRARAVK
jgi:hypothetical protein